MANLEPFLVITYLLNIKLRCAWCQDASFCRKMTAHWVDRKYWLGEAHVNMKNEGTRFKEVSWFWDPAAEWLLPAICPICKQIVSSSIVQESLQNANDSKLTLVECPYCYNLFQHARLTTRGDPRNIAIIGHWDGWQPFSTSSKHSCGTYKHCLHINVHSSTNAICLT